MIYIYVCKKCFYSFEKLYLSQEGQKVMCPECGTDKLETHLSKTISDYIKDYFLTNRS